MDPLTKGQRMLLRFQRSMDPLTKGQRMLLRFQRSMDRLITFHSVSPSSTSYTYVSIE
jgi:hypothetical protein